MYFFGRIRKKSFIFSLGPALTASFPWAPLIDLMGSLEMVDKPHSGRGGLGP